MTTDELIPIDRLAKIYIKIRSKIQLLTTEYEAQVEELKTAQAEVSSAMKDQMLATGSTSIKTVNGTVILGKKTRYSTQDWESFYEFLVSENVPQLLERRIAQGNMQKYLEDNPGKIPAGLNSDTEFAITVRKPS